MNKPKSQKDSRKNEKIANEPEKVAIMEYVIDLALVQTTVHQIKRWFLNNHNSAKYPDLHGEDGWPYYLAHYDWLDEEGRACKSDSV
ncbi:MAG: hypothetical protein LBT45_01390 [Rickettsiales bacterium]|jgi:hypothetical protein|nr:hypothetical protein [Rickettsiales bacterium]